MIHIGGKNHYLFCTAVIKAHYQVKHGVVTNTVNNSTHLRHGSIVWITLIVLRISSGSHKVCSMEGLCMPRNFKKTLFNSTGNLM